MAERLRLQRADGEFAVRLAAQASALSDPTRLTIATALLLAAVRRQRGTRVSTFELPLVHQAPMSSDSAPLSASWLRAARLAKLLAWASLAWDETPCVNLLP
jgi:hypothetical protein